MSDNLPLPQAQPQDQPYQNPRSKLVEVPDLTDIIDLGATRDSNLLSVSEYPPVPPGGAQNLDLVVGPTREQIDVVLKKLGLDWLSTVQREILYSNLRTKLLAGGERAGKSFISALYGATRTMFGSLFWIVGPDYELARPEFDYWCGFLMELGAFKSQRDISRPKIGKASAVTKTGQLIETKTADEVMKLAAKAPDGIIMSEAAQQDMESYLKCIGRIAEKRGWLLMSGTFEGSEGWYAERFNEWEQDNIEGGRSYSMPSWSNTLIYPGGRSDPEILRMEQIYGRVPGMFEERLGAIPIPPTNLIFRVYRSSIHVSEHAKFNPLLPVYLAIDPSDGSNPYSVLACQFETHIRLIPHPDPIDYCNVIDEIYVMGKIAEQVIEIAKGRPWWNMVKGGAIDVEAPDEKKRWQKYGRVTLHSEKVQVLSGIRRLKTFLHYVRDERTGVMIEPPHLRINPRVKSLPYEFRKYKRDSVPDTDRDELRLKEIPPRNQPDHSLKALWYLLISRYGEVKAVRKYKPVYNWNRRQ